MRGFKALRRSWILTSGSRGRILATRVMVTLFSYLLIYGAGLAVRRAFIPIWHAHPFGISMQDLYAPAVYVAWDSVSALTIPILPIALTLFYYDQRIRREGYDIERMMDAAGLIANAPVPGNDGRLASVAEDGRVAAGPSIQEEGRL